MKRIAPILLALFVLTAQHTYGQGWQWARGASMPSGTEGNYCATDAFGNVYGSGNHWGAINFDSVSVTGAGAYVVKYDSSGNLKWAISTNTVASTSGTLGLITDLFGNVYLLGIHDTTLTFGSHTITSPGPHNNYYFLAKIDSSGNVKWLKNIGNLASLYAPNGSNCIATDNLGNIYVTCIYSANATISGYTLVSSGQNDVFVGKFDSSGTIIWAKGYGAGIAGSALPSGIAVTPTHKIYLSGSFNKDSLLFGTHLLVDISTTHMYTTGFLAKLDSNGNAIWARGTGGSDGGDDFMGLATNTAEDVFFTDSYFGSVLHLGSVSLPNPPSGTYGFLAKYDSSGGVSWVKLMKGNFILPFMSAIDPCGNIWIISAMGEGHLTTNDTIDGHILVPPSINGEPNFIACWSNTGTFLIASAISSGSTDDPNSISLDKCGNVYIIADKEYCDTLIIAHDTFITVGGESMFMAKYNPNFGCGCNGDITSLKDPRRNEGVIIYPNPTSTALTITSPDKITSIAITNLLGQTLYTHAYDAPQVQVDVADLPPGMYFVRISGSEVKKFVKE